MLRQISCPFYLLLGRPDELDDRGMVVDDDDGVLPDVDDVLRGSDWLVLE